MLPVTYRVGRIITRVAAIEAETYPGDKGQEIYIYRSVRLTSLCMYVYTCVISNSTVLVEYY